MFCWKCGKELSETACFCSNCGSRVRDTEQLNHYQSITEGISRSVATVPSADTAGPAYNASETSRTGISASPETFVTAATAAAADATSSAPETQSAVPGMAVPEMAAPEDRAPEPETTAPDIHPVTAAAIPAPAQDLVIRKKHISVTDGRLLINGTYYRKTDRRFKKKKGQLSVPLSLIKTVTVCHNHITRRIIASLLLFFIFTAGTGIGGFFGWQAWERLNTPYRQEQKERLEKDLEQLDGRSETQLKELDTQLETATEEYSLQESQLAEYLTQRQHEIMQTSLADHSFDTQALFSTDFFADAYRQYLEDLLKAFLNDRTIHDWLYPYYAYSMELGQNNYIEDEMYFYAFGEDDNIFSAETENLEALLQDAYNYDLYQHIYYTGRIYITASDFMNRVLHVPDYVANGAVFLKAYGGTPDPADLYVPGWTNADYVAFWRDAPAYLDSPDPFWMYFGISAEDFNIDWSELVSEQEFYDAYLKFMDAIAPGLGVFDMVTYSAGDDSYGGMYYDITGKEASVTEIVTMYIEEHPEYLEELVPDLDELPSSFDRQIATAQAELDELSVEISNLTSQRNELAAFLENEKSVRAEYDQLLTAIQEYRNLFLHNLIIFGAVFLLLSFMALISLIMFIRLVKKPKHLMTLALEDGTEAAFSTRFCSKKKLAALEEVLPTQPADPHT